MDNKYIIYTRKSSESEDRQALSLDSQLNELHNVVAREKLIIVDTLSESKSAKKPGRPVFNQLISRIQEQEANSILVWNPDRLSRNSVDAGILIYLLDNKQILEIKTPTQLFRNTPQDKWMLSMLLSNAKYDNDNKGINVKRGMKTKAEMG